MFCPKHFVDELCFVQALIDWLKYSRADQITHAWRLVVKYLAKMFLLWHA